MKIFSKIKIFGNLFVDSFIIDPRMVFLSSSGIFRVLILSFLLISYLAIITGFAIPLISIVFHKKITVPDNASEILVFVSIILHFVASFCFALLKFSRLDRSPKVRV